MLSPQFEVFDERFTRLAMGNVHVERLWTGGRWCEGPAYFPAGKYLVWSDIPNNRVLRYDETDGFVSVFQEPANNQNGHTVDLEGRLISCEHLGRAITRIEHDGSRKVLADRFEGKRLNSPNDAVVKSDGSIWFTDPTYGIDGEYEGDYAVSEVGASYVYRIDPHSGEVTAVVRNMVRPNGLAFSPDESILYVADTGGSHDPTCSPDITAFPVLGDRVGERSHFATCSFGAFDGFRVDKHGNLWCSGGDGVTAYAPDGSRLGKILIPEVVSNVCFGGRKRNRLFICATTSLYAVYLNTQGALRPA
jgi:gluconolactonase